MQVRKEKKAKAIKCNICDGRESNPGQLLGRQLCSPLYHQRLIEVSDSGSILYSKLPRGKYEATTRFANNLDFIRYFRNILPPSRTPGDCYYDAWVIQLLCGKGFLSTRKARNARSEKKRKEKVSVRQTRTYLVCVCSSAKMTRSKRLQTKVRPNRESDVLGKVLRNIKYPKFVEMPSS